MAVKGVSCVRDLYQEPCSRKETARCSVFLPTPDESSQWLNYSKVGGGTLHFFPSLSFPSLPQSSPPLFPSLHPIPFRSRPAPFQLQGFWASAVNSPSGVSGGAPAEIVFGTFNLI